MALVSHEALAKLQELLRQLRGIPQLREKQAGTWHLAGQAFVQFHEIDGRSLGDLRKISGTGFDRYPVDTPPEQRKFIDDAKRRAAKIVDE